MRYLNISLVLIALTPSAALRAAVTPHALRPSEADVTWTNGDLARLSRIPGLISIVGQGVDKDVSNVHPQIRRQTKEKPQWYAARAASLNAQLEAEKARLRDFAQGLDDARELRSTTAGVNLTEEDRGITPEATIDILENRVRDTQSELDQLEDLARHDDIPPGILRHSSPDVSTTTAVTAIQDDISAQGGDL